MSKVNDLHLEILEKAAIDCADVEAVLGDLADGDLMPSLEGRINEHVEGCKCCSESVKSYRWVIKKARMLKPEPMPADVSRRLRIALNQRLGMTLQVESD